MSIEKVLGFGSMGMVYFARMWDHKVGKGGGGGRWGGAHVVPLVGEGGARSTIQPATSLG